MLVYSSFYHSNAPVATIGNNTSIQDFLLQLHPGDLMPREGLVPNPNRTRFVYIYTK